MGLSPTQLTLRELRKSTDTVQVVEKWNPHARVRQDLFGVIDVLALVEGTTVAVQSTSWGNVAARIRKLAESEHIGAMRDAGWRILVHGWRKNKSNRWELRTEDVS